MCSSDLRLSVGRILKSVSSFAATIISGHELDELESIANKFLVLKGGRLEIANTADDVRNLFAGKAREEDGA